MGFVACGIKGSGFPPVVHYFVYLDPLFYGQAMSRVAAHLKHNSSASASTLRVYSVVCAGMALEVKGGLDHGHVKQGICVYTQA